MTRVDLYNLKREFSDLHFRFAQRNYTCIMAVTGPGYNLLIDYDNRANTEWLFTLFADPSREVAAVYKGIDGRIYSERSDFIRGDILLSDEGRIFLVSELPPEEFEE